MAEEGEEVELINNTEENLDVEEGDAGEKVTQFATELQEEGEVKKTRFHIEDGVFPFQQFKIYLFIVDDPQWFLMFLLSHILFWVWAYPIYRDFGYADYDTTTAINADEYGRIESGPSGSGIYPMGFLLMAMGTVIWLTRFFMYDAQKSHPEIQVLGLEYLLATGTNIAGYDEK
mmetsp:Transcript_7363/g.17688  ORF Transcript_7363/g.17688 Transcript_7363/m.17688 type:complete len:174 (+) Transcript_7363:141-662(+)